MFGLSAASTLAKLTPSWNPGAASAILMTSASGYLRLVRLDLGSATEYIEGGAGFVKIMGGTAVHLGDGGTGRWRCEAAAFRPIANNSYSLGIASHRPSTVFGVKGNFTDDVTIGTGKGIVHADGVTANDLLVANGTRYVPKTASLTGKTDNFATYGSITYGLQVTDGAGSPIYLANTAFQTSPGVGFTGIKVPTRPHTHNLSGGVADARLSFA